MSQDILNQMFGFDRLVRDLQTIQKQPTYPPYNACQVSDTEYEIAIAVAGIPKDKINITVNDNKLIVSYEKTESTIWNEEKTTAYPKYLHRGLADRSFTLSFPLSPYMIVNNANMVNGVLVIKLEYVIPDEKKPKIIPIGDEIPALPAP